MYLCNKQHEYNCDRSWIEGTIIVNKLFVSQINTLPSLTLFLTYSVSLDLDKVRYFSDWYCSW